MRLVNENMAVMITAMMNSWPAYICRWSFVLINGTHMRSSVPTRRRPPDGLHLQRSDRETMSYNGSTRRDGESERVNETKM